MTSKSPVLLIPTAFIFCGKLIFVVVANAARAATPLQMLLDAAVADIDGKGPGADERERRLSVRNVVDDSLTAGGRRAGLNVEAVVEYERRNFTRCAMGTNVRFELKYDVERRWEIGSVR